MQRIFTRYLYGVTFCVMLFLAGVNYYLIGRELENKMVVSSESKMNQMAQMLEKNEVELKNLEESLKEDYLTRCRAFAYIIKINPQVLENQQELEKIKRLLNVDELHVIDENGILRWGTIPKYYGMDFASTEQTKPFLKVLEDPNYVLVQDIQPNGAEQKVFQYVGVAREDQPGIVQVGLKPERYLEAKKRNELSYIFSKFVVEKHQFIYAIDAKTNEIVAHTRKQYIGENVIDMGFPENYLEKYGDGGFFEYKGQKGQRAFYVLREYDDIIIGIGETEKPLYEGRIERMWLIVLYLSMAGLANVMAIKWLVKRKIVKGIYEIIDGMAEIQEGRLDTVIRVESNPEFKKLSGGINQMVAQIVRERDYDALTGLSNRRSFQHQVYKLLEQETTGNVAIFMLDLDNFKSINDKYGHACGDNYLKYLADKMKEMAMENSVLGRRSGDEFYMFFFRCKSVYEVHNWVERFYENLRENPMPMPDGTEKVIAVSGGIAYHPAGNVDYDKLLAQADDALYDAKEAKKGGFCEKWAEN